MPSLVPTPPRITTHAQFCRPESRYCTARAVVVALADVRATTRNSSSQNSISLAATFFVGHTNPLFSNARCCYWSATDDSRGIDYRRALGSDLDHRSLDECE